MEKQALFYPVFYGILRGKISPLYRKTS